MKLLALLLAAAALAVVGVGVVTDDDPRTREADPPPAAPDSAGSMLAPSQKIAGEGITIEQALVAETPENLLVKGYLVTDGGRLRLCTGVEGSACVAPALEIDGEPGIEPDGPEPVTVLGALDGRTLAVVNLAAA
jgi:hypothetical protein